MASSHEQGVAGTRVNDQSSHDQAGVPPGPVSTTTHRAGLRPRRHDTAGAGHVLTNESLGMTGSGDGDATGGATKS